MKLPKIFILGLGLILFGGLIPWASGGPEGPAGAVPSDAGASSNLKTSELITVNFDQADIRAVFRILALKAGVNIVAGPEVVGEVTIQLQNVPWKNAFETIVRVNGFAYEKNGNIYYVMTPEELAETRTSGTRTDVITLHYADLKQVISALKNILPNVTVESVAGTNQVLMTAPTADLEAARALVEQVDIRQPQVLIDAKVIRTGLTESESLGINWNAAIELSGAARPTTFPFDTKNNRIFKQLHIPGTTVGQTAQETSSQDVGAGATTIQQRTDFPNKFGFPFVPKSDFTFGTLDFSKFKLVMDMIKGRANTKIVSNPRIVVLNHQSARIQVGEQVGIPVLERNETTGSFEITGFENIDSGIVLNVTPHITHENEVLLAVKPEVTGKVEFSKITETNLTAPRVTTVVAETTVLIRSGDTLVIGGLIDEEEKDGRSKVPYLSNVPLVGWLFKHVQPSKARTETIFFVTVSLADDVYNQQAVQDWQQKQAEYEAFQKESEEEFLDKPKKKKMEWFKLT